MRKNLSAAALNVHPQPHARPTHTGPPNDGLSPECRDFYRQLIDAGPRLNKRYRLHRDMTIVQGDAHVWNIFLPRASGSDDVRIFDWDAWRVDVATDDLA